jgi:hydrogenase expression/formation protein HypC
MCLAVPARVTALLPDGMAKVSLDGVLKEVSLAFVDEVAVGDYVVIHVGYALAKVDAWEAEEALSLLREAARA